jgi:hypothetical protein
MYSFSLKVGAPSVTYPRFGARIEDRFDRERQRIQQERYLERLSPEAARTNLNLIEDTWRNLQQNTSQTFFTLKKPGAGAMAVWDLQGFVPGRNSHKRQQIPFGVFREDTQYLDLFTIRPPKGHSLRLDASHVNHDAAQFRYTLDNYPLEILREDSTQDSQLTQKLIFVNNGSRPKELTLLYGTYQKDLFDVRGASRSSEMKVVYEPTRIEGDQATLSARIARTGAGKILPENTLQTHLRLRDADMASVRFVPVDDNTVA